MKLSNSQENKQGKKTKEEITLDIILDSTWNDYSSGEMGHYTFSPSVYDMVILPDQDLRYYKGYTMQEFVPVLDAWKIFRKGGKFYQNFQHLKSYLITVFEAVQKLLSYGICMTDLKPGNTLYDAEYERGMLIDLAGVIKAGSAENLKHFPADKIKEITPDYADPTILDLVNENEEKDVNLHDFSAFAFGKFIVKIVLNLDDKEFTHHHKLLKDLSDELMLDEELEENKNKRRLTVSEGLERLRNINNEESTTLPENLQEKSNLESFMKVLSKESCESLGLYPELTRVMGQFIDLFSSQTNPYTAKRNALEVENLEKNLKEFLGCHSDEDSSFSPFGFFRLRKKHHFAEKIPGSCEILEIK